MRMKNFMSQYKLSLAFVFCFLNLLSAQAQPNPMAKPDAMAATYPATATDICPLLVGAKIPKLTLANAAGAWVNLNELVSQKPTVLVFYRGGWCPYCTRQLSGLEEIMPDLVAMGYQLVAIGTDSPEKLNVSAQAQQLEYLLLSDANLNAAKQFGLAFYAPKAYAKTLKKGSGGLNTDLLLPVPAVFILDRQGQIEFEYINPDYKHRMNANLLKAVAQSLAETKE